MYKYAISPYLLKLIKEIHRVSYDLNKHHFSDVILYNMEKEAHAISSYSSTSIEGNPLPLTEVRKILKTRPTQIRDTEREVIQYNDTLVWLNEVIKAKEFILNTESVIQIHAKVMNGLLPKVKLGKCRMEPVLVNDPKARKPIFWPPDYKDVTKLMKKLFKFLEVEKSNVDPLILAGIFHKQFVLIHPFIDGNGRTVRLATNCILAELGLDIFSLFSFESYYSRNVSKYFSRVGEKGDFYDLADKVDFTEWLEYFCEGVLDELQRVQKSIPQSATTPSEELTADQKLIMNFLTQKEFIRDSDYAKLTKRAKATRILDFKKLLKLKLIAREGRGPATYYRLKK